MKKRIVTGNTEVEIYDVDPIERMRHRDTDGDGVSDYVDSNGYSKPNDKYRYRDISSEEYQKLREAGFNVAENCRPNKSKPNNYVLRFAESQSTEVDRILKPVLHRAVTK